MTRLIAWLALLTASTFHTLGNMWFTYGIWPRSWGAFFTFWIAGIALISVMQELKKEEK